ncbi:MAG: DMT family transporter [Proteobacteria bacterium]|nr:DMT family transporter [Pseudomonadota bacterium]
MNALPATLRGGVWMMGAALSFTVMLSLIRPLAEELHPFQIAFLRNIFAVLFMAPWIWRALPAFRATRNFRLFVLRALFSFAAMLLWYYGIPLMPLADAIAINFTSPLWATVFAALILGEAVRARRWAATMVGFCGVLIVVRPGFEAITAATAMMLLSSVGWGCQHIALKKLSALEKVSVIVAMQALLLTPLSFVPALFVWTTPSWEALGWVIAMALIGTFAHICLTRAFRAADASAVLPFDFAKMPFAAAIGWFVFAEGVDAWTWAGSAVIVASTAYIARREAVAARTERPAPPDLTSWSSAR